MKKNQLLKTLLILIVLGAVACYLHRDELKKYFGKDDGPSEYLLPEGEIDLSRVKKVTFTSKDKTVTLVNDGGWKVVERYGYPVNMDNLDKFITALCDCRILREMELSDELKSEMKLTDDAGAVTVKLRRRQHAGRPFHPAGGRSRRVGSRHAVFRRFRRRVMA